MKVKIGTILDEDIVQQLRELAAKERRSMNAIINDALMLFFHSRKKTRERRRMAVERLCSRPFNISSSEVNEILQEDYFEQ